ncbi:MAG TPA: 3-isopropylmalate dehydratase small subunit [Burkholderiaceae bacterium]
MSIRPFCLHDGVSALLAQANIDTDTIIGIDRLMLTPRQDLGRWALERLRYHADGSLNPNFVFNQPRCTNATVLICGPNFGCGSSRETAVWALQGIGVRCLVAPSFGDIFQQNCIKNGVLPAVIDDEAWQVLVRCWHDTGNAPFSVHIDLLSKRLSHAGGEAGIHIAVADQQSLIAGLDEIAQTSTYMGAIAQQIESASQEQPWLKLHFA